MRSSTRNAVLLTTLALAGCGASAPPEPPAQVNYEQRLDFLTNHPYEFTCGDERHVNRFGKRTYFALGVNSNGVGGEPAEGTVLVRAGR